MARWAICAGVIALVCFAGSASRGAVSEGNNEVPRGQETKPGPALSAQEAAARMTLPAGFKAEVVAAEPQIINPTAFTFDDRGRIWITESVEYPRAAAGVGQDRIKILESTKNDGNYDKVTVFKDGLNIPSGIALGNGGVYLANSPDLLFLQDTKGTGVCDKQEVLLTGFARDDRHELPNSLTWGPDGWLYGMNGVFNHSRVTNPADGKTYDFTCAIWRYQPKTKKFELFCQGTSNPWGLDYNRQGDWFVSCCVIDHLFHMTQSGYYTRQGGPYPTLTHPLPSITTEKHQQAAYSGLCIYDADAYPKAYQGALLMGNLHGSCINEDTLARNGSTYVQHNAPDFLSAHDVWFMPVSEKIGPDGCVYILDWYDRYHCYQDANRDPPGVDRTRGRLYRITYNDTPHAKPFDLQSASMQQLMEYLGHPNIWWRRQAQRILVERFEPSMIAPLEEMVLTQSDRNNSHMHALWVLLSANAIDGPFLQKLLASGDEATRNWGVRAVGQMGHADSATLEKLKQMARDDVPDVQAQLAISAGRIAENDGLGLLETLLMNFANANDPEIPTLIYNNLKPLAASHGKEILAFLEANPAVANAWEKSVASWIRQAINYSGRNPKEIVADLKKSFDGPTTWQRTAQALQEVVDALTQSNMTADQRAALFDAPLRQRIEKISTGKAASRLPACIIALWWRSPVAANAARGIVADMWSDSSTRAELVRALAESNGPGNIDAFNTLVRDNNTPILIRQSAVDALGSMNDKTAAKAIVDDYATMPPDLKPMAINALTHSVAAGMELMAAISAKVIDVNDVTANHARQLMGLNNKDLSKLVRDTYGAVRTERDPARVQVVEAMRKVIQSHPAGNALAGQAVFNKICTQCHTIYGHGGNVGPDLTGVGRENLDAILTNVLDPSLVIGAPYLVQDVHTKDGQVISGILVEKTDQHIVLKDSTKTMTIPMSNVKRISVENISMMPEGLEKAMSQQEFVDLVAFLLTSEPPK